MEGDERPQIPGSLTAFSNCYFEVKAVNQIPGTELNWPGTTLNFSLIALESRGNKKVI